MSAESTALAFDWEQVDQELASLKLQTLSHDIREDIRKEEAEIRERGRGNENCLAVPTRLIEMQARRTNEWAQRTYEIYCDVWEEQGHSLSPEFLRAVWANGVAPIISGRTNAVVTELEEEAQRTKQYPPKWLEDAIGKFRRDMQQLSRRWEQQTEIQAKGMENRLLPTQRGTTPRERMLDAILKKKARIAHLTRALNGPFISRRTGLPVTPTKNSLLRLEEELQHLIFAVSELENEYQRLGTRAATAVSSDVRSEYTGGSPPVPLLDKYRSDVKRAILIQLTKRPQATDLEVCRGLDADGAADLPQAWKHGDNRSFVAAYRNTKVRSKIEKLISKVRADLRKRGLLA